jgi:DNA polymerase-3 subunit epsilon
VTGRRNADPSPGELPGPARPQADQRVLRDWLRIPERLALPAWVPQRLLTSVLEQARARLGEPLERTVFGIVDLETTGLSADRHRILEIGLVVQKTGRTLERFSTFVDTGGAIPPAITALTGIVETHLEGAPQEEAALGDLDRLLRGHGVTALVAHNAPFDRRFLERAWLDGPARPPLPPFLCSLRLSRRLVRAPSYGLGALARQLSIPVDVRHRALADAEVTARLWWELILRARVEGIYTLEELRKVAEPRRAPRRPRPRRLVDLGNGIG